MSSALESIQEQTKQLDREEKFKLASFIWQDLQAISREAEAYWQEEMTKRYQRIESGETQLISLDDFRAKYAHLEKDLS